MSNSAADLRASSSRHLRMSAYLKLYGEELPRPTRFSQRSTPFSSPPPISALMTRTPSSRVLDRLSPKPTTILLALAEANQGKKKIRRAYGELDMDETDSKAVKAKLKQTLKKRIDSTEQLMMQTRSDLLELRRDIAIYEQSLAKATNLPLGLIRLSGLANGLPLILESLAQVTQDEEDIDRELAEGFKSLDLQQKHSIQQPRTHSSLPIQCSGLRPFQSLADFLIFQGAGSISGLAVLIKATGNYYYKTLTVNLQTLSGESFFLRIDLPKLPTEHVGRHFKTKVLPKFYFMLEVHELKLCYHERCDEDFLALLVELKGYQYFVNTVFLTQLGYEVTIRLQDSPASIVVSIDLVSERESIFEESPQKLCRVLSNHLLMNEDLNLLEWFDSVTQLFSVKENDSKLMDETFVTAFMKQDDFVPFFKSDIEIKGQSYGVLMLVCKNRVKFEITRDFTIKTIHPRSTLMKYLSELQFTDLSLSVKTMLNSLEFEVVLKRLF